MFHIKFHPKPSNVKCFSSYALHIICLKVPLIQICWLCPNAWYMALSLNTCNACLVFLTKVLCIQNRFWLNFIPEGSCCSHLLQLFSSTFLTLCVWHAWHKKCAFIVHISPLWFLISPILQICQTCLSFWAKFIIWFCGKDSIIRGRTRGFNRVWHRTFNYILYMTVKCNCYN